MCVSQVVGRVSSTPARGQYSHGGKATVVRGMLGLSQKGSRVPNPNSVTCQPTISIVGEETEGTIGNRFNGFLSLRREGPRTVETVLGGVFYRRPTPR